MEMARVWPIVCQFGVGGLLCLVGVWFGLTSGYLDLKNREDKRLLAIIVAGYLGLLALSAVFTFWLPNLPAGAAP